MLFTFVNLIRSYHICQLTHLPFTLKNLVYLNIASPRRVLEFTYARTVPTSALLDLEMWNVE